MSREQSYLSIVLKKQPYGEADELITVFTKESGKIRALAKSVKFAKSKLQHSLQVLFLVNLRLTQSHLPKIIGAEVIETYGRVRENLQASKLAFYAIELALKFTADEQKNEQLFDLLKGFFSFISDAGENNDALDLALAKFKIEFLSAMGFSVHINVGSNESLGFSNRAGGFVLGQNSIDARPVKSETFAAFKEILASNFNQLSKKHNIDELQQILSSFLQYHLERDIKSERFLRS